MSYPVEITKTEFEAATNLTISAYLEGDEGDITAKTNKFLADIAYYTFEVAIYPIGDKWRVNKIIELYPEVIPQLKNVMYKVGEYLLLNRMAILEQSFGTYSGVETLESGSVEMKDTQEIISKILPPNIQTYIMNIEPSLVYAGGFRSV